MKRDQGEEIRPQEELEGGSFDGVATEWVHEPITRARALKLAGAALLGGAFTVLWADEADARRKRRRRRRKKRRKAEVTPNPVPLPDPVNLILFEVEKLTDGILEIGGLQILSGPFTLAPSVNQPLVDFKPTLTFNQPIAVVDVPDNDVDATVPVAIAVLEQGVHSGELRLFDANGNTLDIVDLNAT